MKTKILLILICICGMHMTQAQEDREWGFLKTLQGISYMQKIWTQGIDTVYVIGGIGTGMIARSTNQGESWEKQLLPIATLRDIIFTDHNTGYVVGDNGGIVKTSDGGTTWIPLDSGTDLPLNAIAATGPNNIWIVGGLYVKTSYYGIILHSTDEGNTWQQVDPFPENNKKYFEDIAFRNNLGFITGISTVYKTVDYGNTWEKLTVEENSYSPYRSINITENKAYMLMSDCFFSTEDWNNWKIEKESGSYAISDGLFFLDDNLGYHSYGLQIDGAYSGDPVIMITPNGGKNWTEMKVDYNKMSHPHVGSYSSIRMVNDTLGYVVFNESILKMPKPSKSNNIKKVSTDNNLSIISPSGKLIIQSPFSTIQSVDLLDVSGKVLESKKINNNDLDAEINTSHIPHGMYIIRTSLEGNKTMFNKWIK